MSCTHCGGQMATGGCPICDSVRIWPMGPATLPAIEGPIVPVLQAEVARLTDERDQARRMAGEQWGRALTAEQFITDADNTVGELFSATPVEFLSKFRHPIKDLVEFAKAHLLARQLWGELQARVEYSLPRGAHGGCYGISGKEVGEMMDILRNYPEIYRDNGKERSPAEVVQYLIDENTRLRVIADEADMSTRPWWPATGHPKEEKPEGGAGESSSG